MTDPKPQGDLDPADLIPHRPPILCLDRVLHVDADSAAAERELQPGEDWEGCLIEGLAQTAAALDSYNAGETRGGVLVGIRDLALRRVGRVGERVRYDVEIVRRLHPLMLIRGRASAGDDLLGEGDLKFFVQDGAE